MEIEPEASWHAAEAVDPDFADALIGDVPRIEWRHRETQSLPAHWWNRGPQRGAERLEVVHRLAGGLTAAMNGAVGQ